MKRLHVFDLDKTLLIKNSSFAFGAFLAKMGLFSFRQKWAALFGKISLKLALVTPKEIHEKLFKRLFMGRLSTEITTWISPFIDEFLHGSLRSSLIERLYEAKRQGETVLLLSNSPSFLVAAIAKRLGIIYWRATEYASDCKECFTSVSHMMDGKAKAETVIIFAKKWGFSLEHVIAYTDSIDDLPLLEIVGHKMAVAPDKKLRFLAKNRGWPILEL